MPAESLLHHRAQKAGTAFSSRIPNTVPSERHPTAPFQQAQYKATLYIIYKKKSLVTPFPPRRKAKKMKHHKIYALLFVQKKQNKYICTHKREDRLRLTQQEINLFCLKGLRYLRRNNSALKFAIIKVYFSPINIYYRMKQDIIVILDLGSHENTVLARAIRALGVYSEIYPHDITVEELKAIPNVKGIIINGGPNNVIDGVAIDVNPEIYNAGYPVIAAGHDKALCDVKLPQFNDDIEAIKEAVKSFVFNTCKAETNWNMTNFVNDQVELIRRQVGDKKVLLALSGGVDSSVVAALLLKAIGNNLVCVHVNHGLMRKGESEAVVEVFRNQLCANLVYVDATDRFLGKLENVADPEEKRKIIGGEFIRVFEEEARKLDGIDFLGQGTIYPDIVESGTKTAKMVKSHHNVGGLPEDMQFELVEPIRQLFKDEVRACGLELGLPYEMVYRQPFPGPGLGVRCLGAITRDRLEAVRESDAILREEFAKAGLDKKVWQYFTVVPDFKSVGVRDNARSYDWPVIIRAVNTVDAMTATIEQVDWEILMKITDRILKEVANVNRVCYDMSPKPSATIEWE